MIAALRAMFDNFRGSGTAALTVPPMDGAFRPNDLLDTASVVVTTAAPDGLAVTMRGLVLQFMTQRFRWR